MKAFLLRIIRVLRNHNLPAHPQQRPRKRFRNHRPVPSIQNPCLFHRDMKRHHGRTRRPRQQHRPGLSHKSRTARAIDRKSHRPALLQFPPHAQQRPHRSPAARSAHLHKTKLPDNAPRPLPIKAIAAHDPDLQAPPDVGRGKDAAMPKRKNHGAHIERCRRPVFKRNRRAQRWADQPNR